MDDTADIVRVFKTLHVLAIILLGGAALTETLIGPMLAKATSVQQLKVLTRLMRNTSMYVTMPVLFLIPVFGYLTASKEDIDLGTHWILIAQVLFFSAVAISLGYLVRGTFALDKAVQGTPDGPVPPALAEGLKDKKPMMAGMFLSTLFVIIVYLMVSKPGW